uniref:MICOS complex subunit MIC13 n=1 Tax=Steinernema glaseri TaxID=37863 RepID=A0A1I7ZRW9_9BILA
MWILPLLFHIAAVKTTKLNDKAILANEADFTTRVKIMGFTSRLLKTGVKWGVVVGAVKLSIDQEVWSLNTERGSELYSKLKQYILPGTIVYREKLPSPEEVHLNVGSKWNGVIDSIFGYANSFPSTLNSAVNSLYKVANAEAK